MSDHDFNALYEQYPAIIDAMKDDDFTSHQFILELAARKSAVIY